MEPMLSLPVYRPLFYHVAGKFESPDAEWIHAPRTLTDYELIVVSSGVVYMHALGKDFTVCTGDYLLIPPGDRQVGFRPSFSQFYWLHFVWPGSRPQGRFPLSGASRLFPPAES